MSGLFLFLTAFLNAVEPSTQTLTSQQAYPPVITISYPWENKVIDALQKTVIFGNVKPYVSTITINGVNVNVYKTGSFIGYIAPIDLKFNVIASNSLVISTCTRNVIIKKQDSILPFQLISPSTYTEIVKGNELNIIVRGIASTTVYYELGNVCEGYLNEFPLNSGLYNASCYIDRDKKEKKYPLVLKYLTTDNKTKKIKFDELVGIRNSNYIVETTTDNVVLKNDAGGYTAFLPEGVLLISDMKDGSRYRVKFGKSRLWVDSDKVNFKGFSERLMNVTSVVRFFKISPKKTLARISISNKVPFYVREDEGKIYLTLYNTNIRTNWVIYDSSDSFIKNLSFWQEGDEGVFVFDFNEKKELWGYNVYYSTDNYLNVEFKFKPFSIITEIADCLKGFNIMIDPGHSPKKDPPFDGAISPGGLFEYELNLKIADKLRKKLALLGANVYMTRYSNDEREQISLFQRTEMAKKLDADIYISIHNNAIADNEDPYSRVRGFEIYYYHPHSKRLAWSIHQSFLKNIPLPDGGLRFGDYHVLRITSMPSVLVENAYMILPEQEELLLDEGFIDRLADSIKEGVINYLKE